MQNNDSCEGGDKTILQSINMVQCVFTSKVCYGYNILTCVNATIINSVIYLESSLFGGAGYGACTFPRCCGPRTNPRAGPLLGTQKHFVNN
jgi:hypothetical protein